MNVHDLEVEENIPTIETFQGINETTLPQEPPMLRVIVSWVKENSTVGEFPFYIMTMLS